MRKPRIPPELVILAAETPEAVGVHLCNCCAEYKPLTEFRNYSKANPKPRRECNECHRQYEAERLKKKDRRKLRSGFRTIERARADIASIKRVIARLANQFGGLNRLVEVYRDQTLLALQNYPGSKFALDALMMPFNLAIKIEADADRIEDEFLNSMHADEIEEMMLEQCKTVIQRSPRMAIELAAELGWTVTPPDGTES